MNDRAQLNIKIGAVAAAAAAALVMTWEGYSAYVSTDPIGRLQVCYGHDDQAMKKGEFYSRERCRALLDADLLAHAGVIDCIGYPARGTLTDGQKAALVSFAYNVGVSKACASTFIKRLSAGEGAAACAELDKWVNAGGKQWPGLVKRRAAEREMCQS